jgi:hypothetical protein
MAYWATTLLASKQLALSSPSVPRWNSTTTIAVATVGSPGCQKDMNQLRQQMTINIIRNKWLPKLRFSLYSVLHGVLPTRYPTTLHHALMHMHVLYHACAYITQRVATQACVPVKQPAS